MTTRTNRARRDDDYQRAKRADMAKRVGPPAEAVTWARGLAARIADDQERAMVTMVIESVIEGRGLPSWRIMSPLMRAAALALQGKTRPWED